MISTIVRSFRLWAVVFFCVVALGVASAPRAPSATSRIAHLESLVRCPSCEDVSVAQSNATSAVAVRHEITAKVHSGESDSQILTSLEAVYGTSILLSPPTSGLGVLLWLVPTLALAVVVVAAVRIQRRR